MAKRKVTSELIAKAGELAKAGFSDKQIMQAVGISYTAFYKYEDLTETVKTARQELRTEVADALLERAVGGDTSALIFLSKRLGLHQSIANYKKGRLKTAKDAIKELERLYEVSVSGDAPLELVNAIQKILNDFIKAVEVSDLEERIEALEEKTNEKH